jgi:hypothetical protein
MIAEVGTLVRHKPSGTRGRVAITDAPSNDSTWVDFGNGNIAKFHDGDLKTLVSLSRDVPTLICDGQNAHISTARRWSNDLFTLFAQEQIACTFEPSATGNIDVIDFGRVTAETFDLIQKRFDRWLRAETEYSSMSFSGLLSRRAAMRELIQSDYGSRGDQAYLDAVEDEIANRRHRIVVTVNGQSVRELGKWRNEDQCRKQLEDMGLQDCDVNNQQIRYVIESVVE